METKINNKKVKILGVEPTEEGCVFEFDTEVELSGLKSTKVFAGWDVIVGSVFVAEKKAYKKKMRGNSNE